MKILIKRGAILFLTFLFVMPILVNANSDAYDERKNHFLSFASGDINGLYFNFASQLVAVLSSPIGGLDCDKGGSCGIANTQIVNLSTAGSVSNLEKLRSKQVDAAIVQSDMAYSAYNGVGNYKDKPYTNLRVIASLFPEYVFILTRKSAQINSIKDLKGKRVSLGGKGSGSYANAKSVLLAYKIDEKDMETSYLEPTEAIMKMRNKTLDAFFYTVNSLSPSLNLLLDKKNLDDYKLLTIDPYEQDVILKSNKYFYPTKIDQSVYGLNEVNTVSVYALLVTDSRTDNDLIYSLTESLWNETSQRFLKRHDIDLNIDTSLNGVAIPLHDGAKRYYNSIGKKF